MGLISLTKDYYLLGAADIAWHTPIAAWRETDTNHLRTIRHTRTLELLLIESSKEDAKPMIDSIFIVLVSKRLRSHISDFCPCETIAEIVVGKEVVQFVRTNLILSNAGDVAVLISRQQFGETGVSITSNKIRRVSSPNIFSAA